MSWLKVIFDDVRIVFKPSELGIRNNKLKCIFYLANDECFMFLCWTTAINNRTFYAEKFTILWMVNFFLSCFKHMHTDTLPVSKFVRDIQFWYKGHIQNRTSVASTKFRSSSSFLFGFIMFTSTHRGKVRQISSCSIWF